MNREKKEAAQVEMGRVRDAQQMAQEHQAIRGALGLGGQMTAGIAVPPTPVMCSRTREYLTHLARSYRNRAQRIEQLLAALPAELPHEADAELWELVTGGSRR